MERDEVAVPAVLLAPLQEVRMAGVCSKSYISKIKISSALAKIPSEPGMVRAPSAQPIRRKRQAPVDVDSDLEGGDCLESPATLTSANHNKYCHFCQHVKVLVLWYNQQIVERK